MTHRIRPALTGGLGPLVAIACVLVAIAGLAITMDRTSYDTWGAFWVAPVLALFTVPIARGAVRRTGDPGLGRLIMVAFFMKVFVGTFLRYYMVYGVYSGGDSTKYSNAGKILAPQFRAGIYDNLGKISGTRFIDLVTGQVYAGTGPTQFGGFLVFSWFSFLGLWLMCRAFEIAVPEADHRRYRILVLFFPTLLFWPSAIGKDAWMLLAIGMAMYGVAHLLRGRFIGLVPAGLGLWAAGIVRPHIALLIAIAAGVGAAIRPLSSQRTAGGGTGRIRGALLAVGLGLASIVLVAQAQEFFSIDKLSPDAAQTVLSEVKGRTARGGSEFDPPNPNNPVGFVAVLGTVLLRPFPQEAPSSLAIVTSMEGVLLFGLLWLSRDRLRQLPRLAVQRGYVTASLVYVLGFCYAFSSINNFGLLARQRVQVIPFLLVLCALPQRVDRTSASEPAPALEQARVPTAS